MFTSWKVGDEEYRLRLTTFYATQVEKQLGFGLTAAAERLADASVIATILWGALQTYQHGVSFKDACGIYDDYIEDGGSLEGILDVIFELLSQIGVVDKPNKSERKNASSRKDEGMEP